MITNNKNKQELWERIKEILEEVPLFIRFVSTNHHRTTHTHKNHKVNN